MGVLVHIHTFNDADIIERTVEAVRRQSRRPDAILIVDNGSADGTVDRDFPEEVTVVRHGENRGTSGAVMTGFRYALEHGFDWIFILDADSIPEPTALERLLQLYASWPRDQQEMTGFLACLPYDQPDGLPLHGGIFNRFGRALVVPPVEQRWYPCHVTNWSGCLYRLAAVRNVGLPNPDYVLDWGEYEYAYRLMKTGYKAFVDQDAVLLHNIRGISSLIPIAYKVGPITLTFYELPPIRCYYTIRNTLYFTLYELAEGPFRLFCGAVWRIRPSPGRPGLMRGVAWRAMLLTLNFLLRPRTHREHIMACFRGMWHGATGNITTRYNTSRPEIPDFSATRIVN